jgi:hypothetical protein
MGEHEMQRSNEITDNQNLTASSVMQRAATQTVARIYEPNAMEDQTGVTLRNRETKPTGWGTRESRAGLSQGEEQRGTGY